MVIELRNKQEIIHGLNGKTVSDILHYIFLCLTRAGRIINIIIIFITVGRRDV